MKKTNKRTRFLWRKAGATGLLAAGLALFSLGNSFGQVLVSTGFTGQVLPTGWSNIDNGTSGDIWEFDNPNSHSVTGGAPGFDADFAILDSDYFGFSSNQDASLETPTFNASTATGAIVLTFDQQMRNCCGAEGDVDVWNGSTWVNVLSLTSTDGYPNPATHKLIDITTACGASTAAKVRFRYTGNYDYWWAIDNVKIESISCFAPSGLAAGSVTTTGSHISWDTPSTGIPGSGYLYYYSTSSAAPSSATIASGSTTDTFANITSLTSNTQYYVWVRSVCSATDTSDWSAGATTFTTLCATATTPWSYDVESAATTTSSAIGDCWSSDPSNTSSSYRWDIDGSGSTPSSSTGPSGAHSGNQYFYTEASSGSSGDTAFLISPEINVSNLTIPALGFYYHMYGSTMGNLYIQVSANGGTTWNTLDSIIGQQQTSENDPWLEKLVSLSGYTGNLHIRFAAVRGSNYYGDMSLDDISVIEMPNCFAPAIFAAMNITSSTATETWNTPSVAPGNGYQYYYNTTGIAPTTSTAALGSTTDTFVNLTSLTPNSNYYFWVRSVCSVTDTSDWSGNHDEFTTPCNPFSVPYAEGFENGYVDAGDIDGCLSQETGSGIAWKAYNNETSYNRAPKTGNWDAALRYGSDSWVYIPIDLTGGTSYRLKFYARQDGSGASNASIDAAFGAAPVSDSMTGTIVASTGLVDGNYQEFFGDFVPATTGTYYIGIHGNINYSPWYITMDDISIKTTPTCFAPLGLAAGNLTPTAATVSWNTPSVVPGNGYTYYFNTTGTVPTTSTTATGTATDTFVNLSSLTANTQYYIWVRSVCSSTDTSDWSNAMTFRTPLLPVTLPYSEDFTAGGNWALINDNQTNQWAIGAATGNTGNSMYVSDDGGTANTYANTATSVVQAYKDIILTAGTNPFDLSFDWKCKGEGTSPYMYDYFRVWAVPTTFVPTAGTQITATASNGIQIGDNFNDPNGSGNWHSENFVIPNTYAGDTIRLVFEWRNDGSSGSQPPAAIDNVNVSVKICPVPGNISIANISSAGADINWQSPSETPGSGYEYYISDVNTPPTATTTVTGTSTDTFKSVSGLSPNTQYYVWVRSACNSTFKSDWTASANFTTLCDVPANNLGADQVICSGNSVTISTGNTATGNTYLWSDGSTGSTFIASAAGTYYCTVTNTYGCSNTDTVNVTLGANPDINLGNDTGICSGNFVTLSVGNQPAGSTYLWSDGSTGSNLSVNTAGDYAVAVTNTTGCTASDTINVTINPLPTVNLGADTVLCIGSSMTLSAGTQGAGSSYLWSDASTGSSLTIGTAGTYSLTVTTASGCVATDTITVSAGVVPVVNLGADTTFCSGNTLTLSGGAQASGSTYEWSNGSGSSTLAVNATGDYTLTVTNIVGCSASDTIAVTVTPSPIIDLGSDTMICTGTTITLDAGAQTPGTTFLWNTTDTTQSVIVSDSGMYSVLADNNGCSVTDSVLIGIIPLPHVDSITANAMAGGSYQFTAYGVGNTITYDWNFGDGVHSSNHNATHNYDQDGTYTVTLIASNDCGADTVSITLEVTTGVHQISLGKDELKLYPNPAREKVTLKNESSFKMSSVQVYNILGQEVFNGKTGNTETYELHVQGLAAGMYNLRVNFTDGSWTTRKFEVNP